MGIYIPGVGQDDFLAGSCSWSALALLHGHQVADISQHCFEVSHLQLCFYVDRQSQQSDWRVVEELVALARGRREFSTSSALHSFFIFLFFSIPPRLSQATMAWPQLHICKHTLARIFMMTLLFLLSVESISNPIRASRRLVFVCARKNSRPLPPTQEVYENKVQSGGKSIDINYAT